MKPTTKAAARRDGKKVTVSLLPKTHARLNRAAPAHRVSNNRYVQMAIEFFLDCEEAFGGPLTPQFRDATVGQLRRTQEKLKQFLSEG
jgi:predicted transcriptional regulator